MSKLSRTMYLVVMVLAVLVNAVFTTPALAQGIDKLNLDSETVPDMTKFSPGQAFTKSWTVKNTGSTDWSPDYTFTFVSGNTLGAKLTEFHPVANIGLNNTITFSVDMVAPSEPGVYYSYWQMKNTSGTFFDHQVYAKIEVTSSFTSSNTIVLQNGSFTPEPQNFQYREINPNQVEIFFQGEWIQSTPNPLGIYRFPSVAGSINIIEYEECSWSWNKEIKWFKKVCITKQRGIQDTGLLPAMTISREGEIAFYSYLRGLTFGMVGLVANGTVSGINGYRITPVGPASTFNAASVASACARFTVPMLVVSYMYYAGNVFVVSYPISPVPVQVAPASTLEFPSTYVASASDLKPVVGSSIGSLKLLNNYTTWVFISIKDKCQLWMKSSMPKSDFSQLLDFEEKEDLMRTCTPLDIVRLILRIGQKALKAGVSIEMIKQFFNGVLTRIVSDMKLPITGDFIAQLLDL